MKRQPCFPSTVAARPEWFDNYATQLPIANASLRLPAAAVAGTALNPNLVGTPGLSISPGFDNSQLQAVANKLDELITALKR